ncbi:hypothetical protein NE857_31110 [Nocardiopsis exhalans]|uniref:Tetratricopeptide repeat protein n=1 Tax=Nocardiopsis exhalans TaxID=163604 RepID=A0ABY5D5I5_9ACTN|nr:hypothetical protein [Nocardiopsis exhalans]USY19636.1 hypothetical protein NE857_31110 [Nocardiopsis exhalans]
MTSSPPDPAAGTDETRIPGGPGWCMDARTLLPVIEDLGEFQSAHADDRALPILTELWSGRPEKAEPLALALVKAEPTLRHRALLADVRRDLGRISWAVAEYAELIEQSRGTAREAFIWQHLGKAHFVGQDYPKAAQAFETALSLRLRDTAAEDLIASSRMALQRTRTLLCDPNR